MLLQVGMTALTVCCAAGAAPVDRLAVVAGDIGAGAAAVAWNLLRIPVIGRGGRSLVAGRATPGRAVVRIARAANLGRDGITGHVVKSDVQLAVDMVGLVSNGGDASRGGRAAYVALGADVVPVVDKGLDGQVVAGVAVDGCRCGCIAMGTRGRGTLDEQTTLVAALGDVLVVETQRMAGADVGVTQPVGVVVGW